jgi:hypothetical protein
MVNFCCEYFYISFPFSAAVKAAGCFCCRVPVIRTTGKLHAPVRNSSHPGTGREREASSFSLWPLFRRGAGFPLADTTGRLGAGRPCRAAAAVAAAPDPGAAAGHVRGWAVGRWGPASSRAGHADSGRRGRAAGRRLAPHGRPSIIYPCARGPGCAQRACQGPAVGTQR